MSSGGRNGFRFSAIAAAMMARRTGKAAAVASRIVRSAMGASGRSSRFDLEYPTRMRAVVIGPAGMDAGIAADQGAVVEFQPVRIAGVGQKIIGGGDLAGLAVILHQSRLSFLVAFAVIAEHQPDIALIVDGHVMGARLVRAGIGRD